MSYFGGDIPETLVGVLIFVRTASFGGNYVCGMIKRVGVM